jgi:hypothetical protein
MSGISRFLLMEEVCGRDIGHAETIGIIERHISQLKGERQSSDRSSMAPQRT